MKPTIIAIGASAGGLEALQDFLSHLPVDLDNIAVVIAQHVSPSHKSMLVALLSRETRLRVVEAVSGTSIRKNTVYITPPDKDILINKGKITLRKPAAPTGPKPSVDTLFASLAVQQPGGRVFGVILSGTGTDGALGVRALKEAGGVVLVQDPDTAKYAGMPLAALETGLADIALPPARMGAEIRDTLLNPDRQRLAFEDAPAEGSSLDRIFRLLSKRSGTDFANYKPSTVCRRMDKRLESLQIGSLDDYLGYIEANPAELDALFESILIGVTSFFRDADAFAALQVRLEEMVRDKPEHEPIRIWVAGCASGEEAYTIAIMLARMAKDRLLLHRVQIFASDLDEAAIKVARKGVYPEAQVDLLPADIRETYFERRGDSYELVKTIRSMVLFSRHDLTSSPPFLKLDLISCRNLLIYFGAALQKYIIPMFHYALLPQGCLFLGKSETIGTHADLFQPLDARAKLFQRRNANPLRPVRFPSFQGHRFNAAPLPARTERKILSLRDRIKETLLATFEHPYVVITDGGDVQEISGDVRLYLSLPEGGMNANLVKLINKELQIELRSVMTKAAKGRQPARSRTRHFDLFGKRHHVALHAKPLVHNDTASDLLMIVFEAVEMPPPAHAASRADAGGESGLRIRELETELASVKEHLQTYIEELETTNEELQSLNEEMQSANEELQSSNEELETGNEELQSANEEVQIAYAELKASSAELERKDKLLQENEANLNALLNNTLKSFILIDETYQVVAFNKKAEDTFFVLQNRRLRAGESFIDLLDPAGLESFVGEFNAVLQGETILKERTFRGRTGADHYYTVNLTPVVAKDGTVRKVSMGMVDVTELKRTLNTLSGTERMLAAVFNATATGICITDARGFLVDANTQYCQLHGYAKQELVGQHFTVTLPPPARPAAAERHDQFIFTGTEPPAEWQAQRKDGLLLDIFASAQVLTLDDGTRYKVTSIRDITETKKFENLLEETQQSAHVGGWELDAATQEVSWTAEMHRIFETPADFLLTRSSFLSFFSEEAGSALRNALQLALDTGTPFDLELECRTRNRHAKWVRATCKPVVIHARAVKLYGTFQDVTGRKTAEKTIRAGQEKYKAIIDSSTSAFFLVHPSGAVLEVNPAGCAMFGYAEAELRRMSYADLIDMAHPALERMRGERERTGRTHGELTGIRRDGTRFPIEVASVLFDDVLTGEPRLSVMANDITTRKRMEGFLEQVTGMARVGGWELDMKTQALHWTAVTCAIHEVPPDYMPALDTAIEFYKPGESRDTITRLVQECITEGRPWDVELQIVTAAGRERWVRAKGEAEMQDGQCVRLYGTFQDIHERAVAVRELARSEQYYKSLFDQNPDGVYSLDMAGNFLSVNQGLARLAECSEADLLQTTFLPFCEPADLSRVLAHFQLAQQGVPQNYDTGVVTARGNRRVANVTNMPVVVDGQIVAVYGIAKDITDRMEAQRQLEVANNDLNRVMDSSLDVICTTDAEGRFRKVSRAAAAVWGYAPEELEGRLYMDFVFEDDRPKTMQIALDITAGNSVTNFENRYVRKDGSLVPVTWSARWDARDGLMYAIARDTTARKAFERELHKLSFIATSTINVVMVTDPQGILIWVNHAFTTVTGYTPAEALGRKPGHLLQGPDTDPLAVAAFRKGMASLQPFEVDMLNYHKDGSKYWVHIQCQPEFDAAGGLQGYFAIETDITEQRKAQQRVADSERRFRALIENNTDGLITLGADGLVREVSPALTRILGYDAGFFLGGPLPLEAHPDDAAEVAASYAEVMASPGLLRTLEHRLPTAAGTYKWVETTFHNLLHDPVVGSLVVNCRDINQRRQQEEEKRLLIEELMQNNADLKQFSFITSHNLRAPLTNLVSIADLLHVDERLDPLTRNLLAGFKTSTYQLDDTLNDLIKVVLIKESKNISVERLAFAPVLDGVACSLRMMLDKMQAVLSSDFTEAPEVVFVSSYLESIFINLLTNALKYASPARPPHIRVRSYLDAGQVCVTFADNGIGMDMKLVGNRIFGLYQRFTNHPDSKGIGLYLVHSQLASLGGGITVESQPDAGTTFTLRFKQRHPDMP